MRKLWKRLNNNGSALLTVLLVVAFLTILATTLLYITGMNFQIKQADYQNKKNFYTGETALEEIRAELMQVVSQSAAEAYSETCKQFVTFETKEVRKLEFNTQFVEKMNENLLDEINANGGNWQLYLTSCYSDASHATLEMASSSVTVDPATAALGADVTYEFDETNGFVTIKGIKMTYINDRSLATIISTDLELHVPDVDWSAEGTLNTCSDPAEAAKKQTSNVAKSVIYTNWKKE